MNHTIIRPISTIFMGITYLLSQFIDIAWIPYIVSFFALITVASFFPYLKRISMILFGSMIALTIALFVQSGEYEEMYLGLNTNVSVLALFIFVPLLSIPIQAGRFLEYLESVFFHIINNTQQLYGTVKLAIMSVGFVLNMGSIPIVYYLTDTNTYKPYQLLRIKAIGRGFSLIFMWSPYFVSVALVISYFNVNWPQIAIIGLVMCFIGIFLGLFIEKGKKEEIEMPADFTGPSLKVAIRKIGLLLSIIVGMTIVIMWIESVTELDVLTIIPIVAAVLSLIWSSFYLKPREYFNKLIDFTQYRIPAMGNELSLFIVAGVFGSAVMNIGADEWIVNMIDALGISHVLLLLPLLFIVINVLAFIGIHPIISVTIIGMTLSNSPVFLGDHFIIAAGLLASWMVAVSSSPFSGINLLMSSLTNSNPLIAGPKNNFVFALILWVINYVILVGVYLVG